MRWSIISTIWLREMRDQLRDRRTLFMILGLPVILYPLLGLGLMRFALGFAEKPSVIGVVTGSADVKDFPPRDPRSTNPLLIQAGVFTTTDPNATARLKLVFLEKSNPGLLDEGGIDLLLDAPVEFFEKLKAGEVENLPGPIVNIRGRSDDDSRLALRRLTHVLGLWKYELTKGRLARKGLTERFLEPFELRLWDEAAAAGPRLSAIDLVVRVFPFMLVMWSLAGALYPAVDLCAGEKERGTMETLLITPAGRAEIVMGKFLTIWVFSSGTGILNLLSMGLTTSAFSAYLPHGGISILALFWCVVLALPQSAFFSALSLAIGAYARSTKEGQYYLMPLFVLTMPLIFLTLAPGVQLNPLYSLVPVTGVALLMQRLMTASSLTEVPWAYFVPVLLPIALYSWLALRWAIEQFNREEVLFREAEHLDVALWVKSLFREKGPLPTSGQAFFCLMVVIGLRWLSLGVGSQHELEIHTTISQLALLAAPALFMAMLLNTQPREALYLRWPLAKETGLAALLAILCLPPIAGFTQAVASWFPLLLKGTAHPLIAILNALQQGDEFDSATLLRYFLALALVPALCEEIAFRGFVLRGLHHGFRPRNAVLLSSFFFALFHMNVFLFAPTFALGVVLGLLTVRSKSLLPAICFHLLHNSVLIALIPLSRYSEDRLPRLFHDLWPWLIGLCAVAAGALLWWLYRKPYADLERQKTRRVDG